jgi:hypothetical protein
MGVLLEAECLACGHEAELFAGFGFEGVDFRAARLSQLPGDRERSRRGSVQLRRQEGYLFGGNRNTTIRPSYAACAPHERAMAG